MNGLAANIKGYGKVSPSANSRNIKSRTECNGVRFIDKGCVAVISLTWITSVTLFAAMVLPRGGYHFNSAGLLACDPFFPLASLRILSSCVFYFPTTMALMYCYGSAFHVSRLRLSRGGACSPTHCAPATSAGRLVMQERRLSTTASRTMAAMSLGFIVMVTPWTIHEVVEACTGTKVPHFISFVVTWLALSNSFWNPFLYWLLNNHFRRISKELLFSRLLCRKEKPPTSHKLNCCGADHTCPPTTATSSQPGPGSSASRDLEGLGEKYWGEILERTVSSNSLQRLQRVYGGHPPPATPPPPPPPSRPNGIIPSDGRRFFDHDDDDDV